MVSNDNNTRTCILHGVELPRSFWCFVFCWCDRIPNEPRLNVYSVPTFTRHEGRDFLWGVRSLPFSLQPFASESFEQCSKPPLANGFASYRHQFNGDYGPYQYWNRSPLEPPSISQVFRKAQVFQWTLIWWLRILLWSRWPVLATSRLHTGGGCSFLVIFSDFFPKAILVGQWFVGFLLALPMHQFPGIWESFVYYSGKICKGGLSWFIHVSPLTINLTATCCTPHHCHWTQVITSEAPILLRATWQERRGTSGDGCHRTWCWRRTSSPNASCKNGICFLPHSWFLTCLHQFWRL